MKTATAIIQARMSSKRLPGKALLDIGKRPLLSYMLERVTQAKSLKSIIIATSTDASDDNIEKFCSENNISCYRGSLDDVLDRYYNAAKNACANTIVRLTGDCPLIDPVMIDRMVEIYNKNSYDYVANTTPPKWTVPVGMDVEVFSFKALERAWREATDHADREHVTFFFWKNPQIFSVYKYDLEEDLSKYRLTVDYPEDFEAVKAIFSALYDEKKVFGLKDIIEFLKNNPEMRDINTSAGASRGWRSAYKNS